MEDKNLFKIAVVGIGKISIGSHIPAVLGSAGATLVALVDPDVSRAKRTAAEFGLNIEIKASLRELNGDIDGVIIATPNHTHAPLAIEAMERGYHVLIEKPVASTLKDAQAIVETQEKTGKTVAVGYCTRFYQNYQLLKRLLGENYFGQVKRFAYQAGTAGGWWTYSNYILDRSSVGGGVLVVTGTHFIDRMLDLFGYPTELNLEDDSEGGPEANARLLLSFDQPEHSLSGYIHFSKTTKLNSGLVIETEQGFVQLSDNQTDLFFTSHQRPDLKISLSTSASGRTNDSQFVMQVDDFVESCINGTKPMVNAKEALQSIQLIEKAYKNKNKLKEFFYENSSEEK